MSDPFVHLGTVPNRPGPAAGYMIELLHSMSVLASASDLPNSSAMLSACSKLVEQECLYVTKKPPVPLDDNDA